VNFARLERPTRFAEIEKLAHRLMDAIRQVVPALPVSLVATVLLEAQPEGLHAAEVQERVNRCIAELKRCGAPVYLSSQNRVASILNALNMLQLRKLVGESDGVFWAIPDEVNILTYYANAIAHWRQLANGPDR
jgi:glycerol-3-phosphate O-acyltransferase